jgi:hypothetical protein
MPPGRRLCRVADRHPGRDRPHPRQVACGQPVDDYLVVVALDECSRQMVPQAPAQKQRPQADVARHLRDPRAKPGHRGSLVVGEQSLGVDFTHRRPGQEAGRSPHTHHGKLGTRPARPLDAVTNRRRSAAIRVDGDQDPAGPGFAPHPVKTSGQGRQRIAPRGGPDRGRRARPCSRALVRAFGRRAIGCAARGPRRQRETRRRKPGP